MTLMYASYREHLVRQLEDIQAAGTFKAERVIASPQEAHVTMPDGRRVLGGSAATDR